MRFKSAIALLGIIAVGSCGVSAYRSASLERYLESKRQVHPLDVAIASPTFTSDNYQSIQDTATFVSDSEIVLDQSLANHAALRALIYTIFVKEGTVRSDGSVGYDILFSYPTPTFTDWSDHPFWQCMDESETFREDLHPHCIHGYYGPGSDGLTSWAAGAGQFMPDTWRPWFEAFPTAWYTHDYEGNEIGSFHPLNQILMMGILIADKRSAYGRFSEGVSVVDGQIVYDPIVFEDVIRNYLACEWASLPGGAGYQQGCYCSADYGWQCIDPSIEPVWIVFQDELNRINQLLRQNNVASF